MDNLDSMQLERLQAIGAHLNEVRLEQARSLEEIAAKTYIPLRLLKALEAGQGTSLPEPVFIQGFIRRYADVLGLDGLALAQEFPVHTAVVAHEVGSDHTIDNAPLASKADVFPSQDAPSTGFLSERSRLPFIPYVASGAIALVLLGGLVYGFSRLGSSPKQVTDTKPTNTETANTEQAEAPASSPPSTASSSTTASPSPATSPSAATSPTTTASSSTASSSTASPSTASSPRPATSSSSPQATASPTRQNAPVTVDVNLTDRSWLQVVVDGEIEFEGVLDKGAKQSWSGQQEVTILAGNAGAVMVAYNRAKAEAMGELGLVEEMTFTPRSSDSRSPNP